MQLALLNICNILFFSESLIDFRYSWGIWECLQAFKQNYKLFGNTLMLTSDNLATNFSTVKHWLWNEINIINISVNVNICSFISFCFGESLFWGCFGWVFDLVGSAGLWLCAWSAGSACARSWLAGGASDACTAEMCSILLYSVQLMEPSSTRSWLRSGLLGSRTEEPQLLASVDVSVQTACWLYPFTVTHLAAVSCRAVSLDLIYHRFHQSAALPSHQAGFFINVQKAW